MQASIHVLMSKSGFLRRMRLPPRQQGALACESASSCVIELQAGTWTAQMHAPCLLILQEGARLDASNALTATAKAVAACKLLPCIEL